MRSWIWVYIVVASMTFFITGLAIGQGKTSSKFSKYFRPANRTEMDLITLEANVDTIASLMPMPGGIYVPHAYFNYNDNRLEARVLIGPNFEKTPLDNIKAEILSRYFLIYSSLKASIPDLAQDDFVLQVRRLTPDKDRALFAECRSGNIVFY